MQGNEEAVQEATAKLAYELWELRGCPIGSPEVDWLAAEAMLATDSKPEIAVAASGD
jgi:hypothetical protein